MSTNELIDRIMRERELIRKYDESIKQNRELIKRYQEQGNTEGVNFWVGLTERYISYRRTCRKLIELYLDALERRYNEGVHNEQ